MRRAGCFGCPPFRPELVTPPVAWPPRFDRTVHSAVYSPDGKMIATATDDSEATVLIEASGVKHHKSWTSTRSGIIPGLTREAR